MVGAQVPVETGQLGGVTGVESLGLVELGVALA